MTWPMLCQVDKAFKHVVPIDVSHKTEGLDGVYWLENNGHFLMLIRE